MAAEAIASSDVVSGDMIFEPVLEEGVFRFDCSASDRQAAYPSLSFVNGKDRDTPISTRTAPSYTPTYQCVRGQQIVKLEVHSLRTLHFLNFFGNACLFFFFFFQARLI